MEPSSSVSANNKVTHSSFRPVLDLPQKWPINTQPRLRSAAAPFGRVIPPFTPLSAFRMVGGSTIFI